jgi:predicted transcriptional regulator
MEHGLICKKVYPNIENTSRSESHMTLTLAENTLKRRDKLVIMAEIMDISRNGALKTQIMYKANLSFSQLNEYLKLLAHTSLLEKFACNGKDVYKATSKGMDFLERQRQIMDLLSREDEGKTTMRMPPAYLLGKAQRGKM